MDAPVKVKPPPVVVPETEEQRARARQALKTWTKSVSIPRIFRAETCHDHDKWLREVLSYDPYSGEFTWIDIAPSLQEHEAARLRPIWRERHQGMSPTGGFTFLLQCAFNPMARASAILATTSGVRLVGRPSSSLPRLLMLCAGSLFMPSCHFSFFVRPGNSVLIS